MKYKYQLSVRLPEDLATALHEQAKSTKRSMNAEIIHLLQQSLESQNNTPKSQAVAIVELATSLASKL
jgi:plasmid stability protein